MSWRSEYREAMYSVVLRDGQPLNAEFTAGWHRRSAADRDRLVDHAEQCELRCSNMVETEWSTFTDTFGRSDDRHGVDVTVSCACGQIQRRVWRWEGTVSELLLRLLEEDE